MITSSHVDGPPPYVGGRPFGSGDEEVFFGRADESAELARLWRTHRLTLLHGHAGAGKTSLLAAGVVPRLEAGGEHVLGLGHIWRHNAFPTAAFPEQNPFTLGLLSSWYPSESPADVAGTSVLGFLRKHARKDRFGRPVPTLAAIDQAELLFRGPIPHERQRRAFLGQLGQALLGEPRLRLLLCVRDDHLDEALAFARGLGDAEGAFGADGADGAAGRSGLDDGDRAAFRLGPFDRDASAEAVRGPLVARGHTVPAPAVARLVDELHTFRTPWTPHAQAVDTVEPALLQTVCSRLWSDFPGEAGVPAERLGAEVDRVLAGFCARSLAMVAADHRVAPGELASWFREAFAERQGGVAEDELPRAMSGPVVRALEDLHLIKARRSAGGRRYELMHPRLARTLHGLGERSVPVRRPGPAVRLRAAEVALCEGAADLARHHTEGVIRACGKDDLRVLGRAELLLGNIAHEQGRAAPAARHYRSAAQIFEVLQDTRAVGLLLAAVGRLVMDVNAAEAVSELRTAANRLPNDLTVHIALGQALWQAGQIRAALAVLDGVLARDGDASEALRTRGEILADLGQAGPALRDLSRVDRGGRSSTEAAWLLAVTMHARGAPTADAEADGSGTASPTGEAGEASPAGGTGGTGRAEQAGAAGRSGETGQAGEAGEAHAALDGAGRDAVDGGVDGGVDGAGGTTGDGGPDPGSGARRGRPTPDALPENRQAPELPAVPDAESGPVLLRIARAHRLHGDAEFAAEIAARAVAARHPPLPPQMRDEARGLEHRPFGTDRA